MPVGAAILFLLASATRCAGGSAGVTVAAVVLSKNQCRFDSRTASLNFGALDPIRPVDVATSTAVGFVCRGSAPIATFAITENGGLYSAGPGTNRMRHATVLSEYLPYRLALEPDSGTVPKNARQTLTITGTLRGADYSGSSAGSYADTVVVDILP